MTKHTTKTSHAKTKTNGTNHAKTKSAPAQLSDTDRANLAGLVDEARGHVDTLATLYACADADECGATAEGREAFNAAVAGIVGGLECIALDYAKPKAVTSYEAEVPS